MKSPGIDGYGSKNFKASWKIVKHDVMRAIRDFFDKGGLYKDANCTIVSLIPKTGEARIIKGYRPIVGYTNLYKIIPSILKVDWPK